MKIHGNSLKNFTKKFVRFIFINRALSVEKV